GWGGGAAPDWRSDGGAGAASAGGSLSFAAPDVKPYRSRSSTAPTDAQASAGGALSPAPPGPYASGPASDGDTVTDSWAPRTNPAVGTPPAAKETSVAARDGGTKGACTEKAVMTPAGVFTSGTVIVNSVPRSSVSRGVLVSSKTTVTVCPTRSMTNPLGTRVLPRTGRSVFVTGSRNVMVGSAVGLFGSGR